MDETPERPARPSIRDFIKRQRDTAPSEVEDVLVVAAPVRPFLFVFAKIYDTSMICYF
jgi:hypothetical protein